jgi:hypothetical protein
MQTESVQIQNCVSGQFVEPIGGRYVDNIEPVTSKPFLRILTATLLGRAL